MLTQDTLLLCLLQEIQDFVFGDSEDSYEILKRMFLWTGLLLGGLILMHSTLLLALARKKWSIPSFLEFPRLELYTCHWVIPAIAAAAGVLLKGDTSE